MIQFRRLVIKNFLCFGERQEIPLHKQGVVRIEGQNFDEVGNDSNGSGKSAIVEAIVWCLFGKTIRKVSHEKVVNRFSKKDCSVSLEFRVGDSSYNIKRYRASRKHGNRVHLWRDERSLTFRHEEDTQSRIEDIIGTNYLGFVNSVLFGGIRPFSSLPDAEQKRVLESFLHFEEFERALRTTRQAISTYTTGYHELELREERLKGITEKYHDKIQTLKGSEEILRQRQEGELRKAEQRLEECRLRGYGVSTRRVTKSDIDKVEDLLDKLRDKSSRQRARVAEYEDKLHKVRKAISDRASLVGKPCPTCGGIISKDTITAYLEHLSQEKRTIKSELRHARKRLSRYEGRFNDGSTVLKDLQTLSNRHDRIHMKGTEAEDRVRRCERALAAKSSASPLEVEIAEASIKYSNALSQQLVLGQKRQIVLKGIEDLKFWEKGFGNKGIKALIVREALPALNAKLSEYAEEIFNGRANLKFLPSKEKRSGGERELFHVRYSARRGADSYAGESTGRQRRADVCVLLCFAWLSRNSDLLLCDELLDGLDDSGRDATLGILSRLRGTVLVISHRKEMKSYPGKVWTVVKKHGYSKVVLE